MCRRSGVKGDWPLSTRKVNTRKVSTSGNASKHMAATGRTTPGRVATSGVWTTLTAMTYAMRPTNKDPLSPMKILAG